MNAKEDTRHLARAIQLADKGRYSSHPNPRVGCVLVCQGEVIGEGYHVRAGEGHAEVNALANVAARFAGDVSTGAKGATAYITLEPCSFQGRTPSCAEALIAAGVTRVVVAMPDPDPRNAGKGIQMLRQAGIEVTCPLLEDSARALNPGHIKRHEVGLPFVRLKLAMSLDGKTALANGQSKWITSTDARLDVQRLRAESAAIVTGVQTVIDDDPLLSVRDLSMKEMPDGDTGINLPHFREALAVTRPVYILDSRLRTPLNAALLKQDATVLVALDTTKDVHGDVHGESPVLTLPATGQQRIDLRALLEELARREHNEVLFECGPTLAGALVSARLVDEVVLYVAPSFMGDSARSLLKLPEIDSMSGLVQLTIQDIQKIGPDLRVTATLAQ